MRGKIGDMKSKRERTEVKDVFPSVLSMFMLSVCSFGEIVSLWVGTRVMSWLITWVIAAREKNEKIYLPPSTPNCHPPPCHCHYQQYFTTGRKREKIGQEKGKLSWYQLRGNIESLYKLTHCEILYLHKEISHGIVLLVGNELLTEHSGVFVLYNTKSRANVWSSTSLTAFGSE